MASTASEAKAESKPEAKAEVKEKEAEENQERLKYKTWVLRVSINCEGCKRKVKKILTNIDGVYTSDIDLRQQKVIVIGDVDAETLIRELEKNGKHAELWPESKVKQKEKKQSKSKNKEKQQQSDQENSEEGNNNPSAKETEKVEVTVKESSKNKKIDNGGTSKRVETNGNEVGSTSEAGGSKDNESKPEVKQTVTVSAGSQSPVGDKKVGGGEGEGEYVVEKSGGTTTGSGSGGKKKKKKGNKGSNGNGNVVIAEGEPSGNAPAGTGSPIHGPNGPSQGPYPSPASYSPPCQHGYQYPQYPPTPHYYTPPVNAVSYNTAYPRPSYSASYYAASTPYSYAYMNPGMGGETPPSNMDSYSSQPSSDSFEIFSDENPNACSIM